MKLSTRCRYGTRAMVEIARHYNRGPTKRKDISRAQDISEGYLENILSLLRSRNYVSTVRGAGGGFVLEKPPAEIKLLDIVLALEGTISPVDCLEKPEVCEKIHRCVARKAWRKLYDAQVQALSEITLQDMLDMEEADSETTNYVI